MMVDVLLFTHERRMTMMHETEAVANPYTRLLPRAVVCRAIGLAEQTLKTWMYKGYVTPTHRGHPGGGPTAAMTFDFKAALGLAHAAAFQEAYGNVPGRAIRMLVGAMVRMSDQEHEALWTRPDAEPTFASDFAEALEEAHWRRQAVFDLYGLPLGCLAEPEESEQEESLLEDEEEDEDV
jgi:hypothetical protein